MFCFEIPIGEDMNVDQMFCSFDLFIAIAIIPINQHARKVYGLHLYLGYSGF